jgi:oligoribonuclease NrnB/cAMP/cGMP phosphodiesterase (DHH superfamily)
LIHIIYHDADLDGKCSGAIVEYYYKLLKRENEVLYTPYNYEKLTESHIKFTKENDTVYMVDVSFQPFSLMETLNRNCNNFIWIDHHISAIKSLEKSEEKIKGKRVDGIAACRLTWKYLFPNEEEPIIVEKLGKYDVFDLADSDVFPVQYYCRSKELDPMISPIERWISLFKIKEDSEEYKKIVETGSEIYEYEVQRMREYAKKHIFIGTFEGYNVLFCNCGNSNSLMFHNIENRKSFDFCVCFSMVRRNKYSVSLYCDWESSIDLSLIAKKYGGGGHKKAAGFTINDINKIIN